MTTPIADEKLPELEALLAGATPADKWSVRHGVELRIDYEACKSASGHTGTPANAALIVFLRNHGDALLARIRSDQQEREALNARVRELEDGLRECGEQFAFYVDEHCKAGKIAKAATNQGFADLVETLLTKDGQ